MRVGFIKTIQPKTVPRVPSVISVPPCLVPHWILSSAPERIQDKLWEASYRIENEVKCEAMWESCV